MKHLVANKPKVLPKDREKLRALEDQLQEIRLKGHVLISTDTGVIVTVAKLLTHLRNEDNKTEICSS